MKRAMLILCVLVLAASGCVSVREVGLHEELAYELEPPDGEIPTTDKVIAVVVFDDERPDNGAALSGCAFWNLMPLVWSTTKVETRPEMVYPTTSSGLFNKVVITGTLADAIPRLLVGHLQRSGRAPNAVFGEPAPVKGKPGYDYLLRGTVVGSTLTRQRCSHGLGILTVFPYLLGATTSRSTAWLEVEWQLFDAAGKPLGQKSLAALERPIVHQANLYCGGAVGGKNAPAGLYIEAIKAVNEQIAFGVSELVGE